MAREPKWALGVELGIVCAPNGVETPAHTDQARLQQRPVLGWRPDPL